MAVDLEATRTRLYDEQYDTQRNDNFLMTVERVEALNFPKSKADLRYVLDVFSTWRCFLYEPER
jgi:hypothetical protein